MQDMKSLKTSPPTDFDEVVAQLAAMRDEVARLTHSLAGKAENRGRKMASDIADGVSEATHYVERKGRSAESELEASVAAHPLMALSLAAIAGVLIGALTRR